LTSFSKNMLDKLEVFQASFKFLFIMFTVGSVNLLLLRKVLFLFLLLTRLHIIIH